MFKKYLRKKQYAKIKSHIEKQDIIDSGINKSYS